MLTLFKGHLERKSINSRSFAMSRAAQMDLAGALPLFIIGMTPRYGNIRTRNAQIVLSHSGAFWAIFGLGFELALLMRCVTQACGENRVPCYD